MKKEAIACFFALVFFMGQNAFAFSISNPFSKKYDKEKEMKEPMVHTVDEWMESATSLKMDMRKREDNKTDVDEKYIPPARKPIYIERYNVKAGSRELDLTKIYNTQNVRSAFVSDNQFNNAVYSEVYYYPQTRQVASTFYLIELDKHLGKKERLEDVSIFEHTRYPLISTALPYLKENMFSTLTMVDFSSDSEMILVKERRGSHKYGLYETYVWIYYLTDESRENNLCYMNNVNFSNEISSFEGLDGRNIKNSSKKLDKNQSFKNYNLNNLSNVPASNIFPNSSSSNGVFAGKINTVFDPNNPSGIGTIGFNNKENKDTSWLREGVIDVDKMQMDASEMAKKDDVKLDYKMVKNFIKAVWKQEAMTSPTRTRWYNEIPVDFRVDDNYTSGKENIGFGVRLNLLNEMIKAYWFDRQNLILNHIRWDLNPLGFSATNEDEIIVEAWSYNESGGEISLGRWAVNVKTGIPRLVLDNENVQIQANAFYLEEKLNTR